MSSAAQLIPADETDDAAAGVTADADGAAAPDLRDWVAVSRGVMLFLGVFALLNLLAELGRAGLEANLWWLDLPPCSAPVGRSVLSLVALCLVSCAVRPSLPVPFRRLTTVLVLLLLGVAVWSTLGFYSQVRSGTLRTELGLPLSLHVAACLIVVLAGLRVPAAPERLENRHRWILAGAFLTCAATFPLAQIYCSGKADFQRPADVIVLVGPELDEADEESTIAGRIETACRLYEQGRADRLILTGGPGEDGRRRSEELRRLVLAGGVPGERIETAQTDLGFDALAEQGSGRILAVGRFYELPLLSLRYRRAGIDVSTVPVPHCDVSAGELTRAVGNLWSYYLRPFAG